MDAMTACLFKESETGRPMIFPWGASGRGYVLESDRQREEIQAWLKRFVILTLSAAVFLQIMLGFAGLVAVVPASLVLYHFLMRVKLKNSEVSSESLKFHEAYEKAASAHRLGNLLAMELAALLFIGAGLYLILAKGETIFGLIAVAFSAVASLAIGYMIVTKRRA